jgi:Cu/Ag efflux protein CusF
MAAAGVILAGLLAVSALARAAELAYPDVVYMQDRVDKMDMSTHQVTLASGKTMKVADDAKVMKEGKPASMSDVKSGDQIRAGTSGQGDAAKIVEIWILKPGAAATGTGSENSSSTGGDSNK